MSYPYFFINQENLKENKIFLEDSNFNHLVNVLRAKTGDKIIVSDSINYRYHTTIENISKRNVLLNINKKDLLEPERISVHLYQCIIKKTSMEIVIQKATEIGSSAIIPVISDRAVAEFKTEKIDSRIKRWQEISDQAAGQSRRIFKCEIFRPISIKDINIGDYDLFFMPYENADNKNARLSLGFPTESNLPESKKKIGVIIGPEGGFSDHEAEDLKKKGARIISFGKNILRAETAAIYFLSILDHMLKVSI